MVQETIVSDVQHMSPVSVDPAPSQPNEESSLILDNIMVLLTKDRPSSHYKALRPDLSPWSKLTQTWTALIPSSMLFGHYIEWILEL